MEHPFFVIGQGWSSCSPARTLAVYGLQCQKLRVGDICISLSRRSGDSPCSGLTDEKPGNHLHCAGTSSVVLEPVNAGSKSSSSSSPTKSGEILLQSANQLNSTASAASSSRSNGNGSPPDAGTAARATAQQFGNDVKVPKRQPPQAASSTPPAAFQRSQSVRKRRWSLSS